MMPTAQPTPAPIHDITGPVWFLPVPLWMIVVAALAVVAVVALLVWFFRRRKAARPLTARERALAELARLRVAATSADAHAFGFEVSDVLRTYIRDQHGLDAVTRTSVEFLEVLQHNAVFSENERASIGRFLEVVDLLKYARQEAEPEDMQALVGIAERLVRGENAAQPEVAR
jgi:hypothetical protein